MKRKKILAVLLAGSLMVPFASSLTFGEDILVGEEAPVFTDGEIGYEEPVFEDPAYEEPVYDEPAAYEEPVYDEPVAYEEPVYDEPAAEQPAVQEEQPAAQEPVVQEEQPAPEEQQVVIYPDEQQIQDPAAGPTQAPDTIVINQDSSLFDGTLTEPVEADLTKPVYILSEPGASGIATVERSYDSLSEAISEEYYTNNNTDIKIVVSQNLQIDATINIPSDVDVSISPYNTDISITRAASLTGDMFSVEGTLDLGSDKTSPVLKIDGNEAATGVTGSIISVENGGSLNIHNGVTLTGNRTSGKASAIYVSGDAEDVYLTGGTIEKNETTDTTGGAVYLESDFPGIVLGYYEYVSGPIKITDNKAGTGEGKTDTDIIMGAEGQIQIGNILDNTSVIKIRFEEESQEVDGANVVQLSGMGFPDGYLATASALMTYEHGNYIVNNEGNLADGQVIDPTETPTPTPSTPPTNTPTQTPTVTPTRAPGSTNTPTPTPTKTITNTPRPTVTGTITVTPSVSPVLTVTTYPSITITTVPVTITTTPARDPYIASINRCSVTLSRDGHTYNTPAELTMRVGDYYEVNRTGDYGAVNTYGNNLIDGDQQYVPYFLWWSKDANGNPIPQSEWQFGIRSSTVLRQSVTDNITLYVRFKRQYWSSSAKQFVDDGTTVDVPFQIRYTALPNVTTTPAITVTITPTSSPYSRALTITAAYQSLYGNRNGNSDSDSGTVNTQNGTTSTSTNRVGGVDYLALTRAAQSPGAALGAATSLAGNPRTADDSPVGTMVLLASLSMLAGGYVIVRKRKKEA